MSVREEIAELCRQHDRFMAEHASGPIRRPHGPIEATYVALVNRIAASREHNRNGLGRRHGSQYRSATSGRGDHVDITADQIGRKGRQSIVLIFCKTVFDRRVAGQLITSSNLVGSWIGRSPGFSPLSMRAA